VVEYGVWVWIGLGVAWVARAASGGLRGAFAGNGVALLGIGALALHAAYYTLVIGGDHFEYRVYSHAVLLLFLSAVWLAARVFARPASVYAAVIAFVLASWPVPWVHWLETRDLTTRAQTLRMARPIAARFPPWVRPPVEAWDGWQAWLARRRVCVRHQEHKVFAEHQQRELPTRSEGSALSWDERAVIARGAVGVVGWVIPDVAVIDEFGLNDRVVARNPAPRYDPRRMGHDRKPPPGYVACFRPNLEIEDGVMRLQRREDPLTDDEIRACESRAWPASPPKAGAQRGPARGTLAGAERSRTN
jgi:arabinofuranosyltransferase